MDGLFNGRLPSVKQHDFARVPTAEISRSTFRRPSNYKTTFDAGYLIPFFCDEVLPGDTHKLNTSIVARLATPIVPFMDNLHMDVHFFFVPNRLVWNNWEKFMGAKDNPGDTTEYLIPTIAFSDNDLPVGSIYDYFGLPCGTGISLFNCKINALPFRAYNLIYNEWYRDQNLINSLTVSKGDGPDAENLYALRRRAKRHDYFTSCLPWPQKGEAVDMPIGTSAPVYGDGHALGLTSNGSTQFGLYNHTDNSLRATNSKYGKSLPDTTATLSFPASTATLGVVPSGVSGLYADLSQASAVTINQFREAVQLQRLLERDARGGTRYIEILKSHFLVNSPDMRLQRPEYLGGGTIPVQINSVPQTSSTDTTTPQGNMSAYGYASGRGIGFNKSFVEHGYIIGILSVRADLTYQRRIDRMWSRREKYDFYWPALAHIGEQPVYNREIFATDIAPESDGIFGYQEAWADLRYKPSMITGKLRSDDATPLDMWHLSQHFTTQPTLGQSFIEENPPISRVVAVTSEPQFVLDSYLDLICTRPMPMYSVPGMVDHF